MMNFPLKSYIFEHISLTQMIFNYLKFMAIKINYSKKKSGNINELNHFPMKNLTL